VQALRHVNVLGEVENLVGWLYRTAANRVVDWLRKRRLSTVTLDAVEAGEQASLADLANQAGLDVHEALERTIVSDAIEDALQQLPDAQREVFVQQAVLGRTFRSIAEETGIPLNTLLGRKRAAVLSLRTVLADVKDVLDAGPDALFTTIEEDLDG
jgi:RNA polymerase sigma factor (sigma-70 family)